jgi:hypothetical protein
MIAIKAHFDGKVLVPDEPVELPKGTPLVVHVEVPKPKKPKRHPKKQADQSLWQKFADNVVESDNLPPDLAHQHDHYLYGTPKKPEARS